MLAAAVWLLEVPFSTTAPVKIASRLGGSSPLREELLKGTNHLTLVDRRKHLVSMLAAAGRATVRGQRETQLLEPQAQSPVGRDCTTFESKDQWVSAGTCHFNGLCRCHRVFHVRRDAADSHRMGLGLGVWRDLDRPASGCGGPAISDASRLVSARAAARDDGRATATGSIASGALPGPIGICQRSLRTA